jgi:nucleotide-binding universal stress UspA family protein
VTGSPVGKVGRVVVRIRGGESPGEVRLVLAGTPETYVAYCDDEVSVGADVLVIGFRGARRVDVVPWEIAHL